MDTYNSGRAPYFVAGAFGEVSTQVAKTTAKYARKFAQLHACHAPRSSSRTQPDVVGDENHVLEKARSPRCAPQTPEGDAHSAENKGNLTQYSAEHNPMGGCKFVSNSPNGMRRQNATSDLKHDI